MIRPITLVTALLAAGSGLYLYHAKHMTQLLDNRIAKVQDEIHTDKERIAVLSADWALENAPSRLANLAQRYLTLQPMKPSQAIRMADLDSHLPPPVANGGPSISPDVARSSPVVAGLPPLAVFASLAMLSGGAPRVRGRPAVATPSGPDLATTNALASASTSPTTSVVSASVISASPIAPRELPEPPLPVAPPIEPVVAPVVASAPPSAPIAAHPLPVVASERPAAREPRPVVAATPAREPEVTPPREVVAATRAPNRPAAAPHRAGPPPHVREAARAPASRSSSAPAAVSAAPAPILASALGGQYPNMPPPAPLSVAPSAGSR